MTPPCWIEIACTPPDDRPRARIYWARRGGQGMMRGSRGRVTRRDSADFLRIGRSGSTHPRVSNLPCRLDGCEARPHGVAETDRRPRDAAA